MTNQRTTGRLQELDALRGIAAVAVMIFHYTFQYIEFYPKPLPAFNLPWGRYGVQLFFVISGFVIFLTLSRSASIWDFAANRFIRLYPPYWVSIAITFSLLAVMPMPGLNVSPLDAVLNLSMLQYWLLRPFVDSVYWTLSVELVFYAFVAFLHFTGWLRRVELWMSVWLAVIFFVQFLVRSGINISPLIRTSLLLEHGHFFFAGVLFHRMKSDGFNLQRWLLLIACIAAARYVRDTPHAISLIVSSALFIGFITGRLTWIVVTPLVFLGDISYPLYLLHQNIGYAIISRLDHAGLKSEAWLLVPMAVSILLAFVVNRLVEKPSRERLRAKWKGSALRRRLVKNDPAPQVR